MNGSFTEHCRNALQATRSEALRLQHDFVAPGHVLLGLLQTKDGVASTVLNGLETDRDALRVLVQTDLPGPDATAPSVGELPYKTESVALLKSALREARDDGSGTVHTGHLLLACFTVEEVAVSLGVGIEDLRTRVIAAARDSGED